MLTIIQKLLKLTRFRLVQISHTEKEHRTCIFQCVYKFIYIFMYIRFLVRQLNMSVKYYPYTFKRQLSVFLKSIYISFFLQKISIFMKIIASYHEHI